MKMPTAHKTHGATASSSPLHKAEYVPNETTRQAIREIIEDRESRTLKRYSSLEEMVQDIRREMDE
jgi:hypothetical protein